MTKRELKWEHLTHEEAKTLATLRKNGTEVFPAPILIEEDAESRKRQFESLGITWEDCKTWYIGSEKVRVHLTPANEATYNYLLGDLRAKHRDAYRERRCFIPGKLKSLIRCPEHNRCAECPYPEYRDRHKAQELSWDTLIESGYEEDRQEDEVAALETRMELDAVMKVIDAKNPKYTKAIVLKEYYGLTVSEIAKMMNETERNIYFYLAEVKKIGAKFKRDNQ